MSSKSPLVILKVSENNQDAVSDKWATKFAGRIVEITRRDNTAYEWYVANSLQIYSVLVEIKEKRLMPEEFLLIDTDGSEIKADQDGRLERYPEILNSHTNLLMKLI